MNKQNKPKFETFKFNSTITEAICQTKSAQPLKIAIRANYIIEIPNCTLD